MGQGFPSRNPRNNRRTGRGLRPPQTGTGLMEWMSWNFPTVFEKASNVQQDSKIDKKSRDYDRQHPTMTGRVP